MNNVCVHDEAAARMWLGEKKNEFNFFLISLPLAVIPLCGCEIYVNSLGLICRSFTIF